ncbi:MAG: DUF4837 family protein [Candidatus Glassbacteria bacterium]|nr:DUF4837 family protein [Candidatus Glassbacteria bacterium]
MRTFPRIKFSGFLLLSSVLLLAAGCGDFELQKPRAFGREKEILVICSDSVWQATEKDLRRAVEVPIHAVRWEPIFEIAQIQPSEVDFYKEWDKIILVESLENMSLLPDVVDQEMLEKIAGGQGLFFTNFDIWARGQRVAGLAAPTDAQLVPLVRLHGHRIYKDFLRQLEEEEKQRMYFSGRNVNLEDSLASCCGFSLVLPRVYERIRMDTLARDQLLFVHVDPVRSIFITWEEGDNLPVLDYSPDSLAARRDRLLADVYPDMQTVPGRVDTSTVVVGGLERLRVYGVWENLREISGGIYISQIIEAPAQRRRYTVDCRLFCPDPRFNKYRYILQLDRIMDSFKVR